MKAIFNAALTSKLVFSLLLLFLLPSCEKEDLPLKASGTLKNLTGLDGCGWVVEINENGATKRLEPTNLNDFSVTLTDGQKVRLSYVEKEAASVCMVGPVVQLVTIQDE
jgi:hypothetical protein